MMGKSYLVELDGGVSTAVRVELGDDEDELSADEITKRALAHSELEYYSAEAEDVVWAVSTWTIEEDGKEEK